MAFRPDPTLQNGLPPKESGPSAQPQEPIATPQQGPGMIERNLPTIGSIAGGFAGPVGAGAGYGIGRGAQEIIKQLRPLTSAGGDTKYSTGFERLANYPDLGKDVLTNLFNYFSNLGGNGIYKKAMGEALPANVEQANKFGQEAVGGSIAAGTIDYATRKVTAPILDKLFPKLFGPLAKVSGVKPSSIEANANKLADESWSTIQKGIDDAASKGKTVNVADIIDKLENLKGKYTKGFTGELPERVSDTIKGIDSVISDLKVAGKKGVTTILGKEELNLDPQATQTLKSLFGKESFSPKTGMARSFSGLFEGGEQSARKMAGGELRNKIVQILKSEGVKNPEDLLNTYGRASKFGDLASDPSKLIMAGAMVPGVIGGPMAGVLAGTGQYELAAFLSSLLYGVGTPYGRQLLREGVKLPIKAIPSIERGVAGQYLQGSNQENK